MNNQHNTNSGKLTTAIRLQVEETISQIKKIQDKQERYKDILEIISYRYPEVYQEISEYFSKKENIKKEMQNKKYWDFWMYQGKRVSPTDIGEIPIKEHINITYETVEVTEEEYNRLVNLSELIGGNIK